MADFMIRFLLCNLLISLIIGILFTAKRLFHNHLTGRMHYHLWFLMLVLLAVPFIPAPLPTGHDIISWITNFKNASLSNMEASPAVAAPGTTGTSAWMNDFALSAGSKTSSVFGWIMCGIWIAGILAMLLLVVKSFLRLRAVKNSALPLQNVEILGLYSRCLHELNIKKNIPVYSTAFLKSPMTAGIFRPYICLPLHLVCDYKASELRYMLLHELQHYKHRDSLVNILMNLVGVVYWFNPAVWFALKEMRGDREVACDTSVLKLLDESSYEDYGNTLIDFAERVSLTPFPFTASLGGNRKQMEKRILNIAAYRKPTFLKRLKGMAAFMMAAVLLFGLAPILSTYAADTSRYQWDASQKNISYSDLSESFGKYEGSFVLYNSGEDSWSIHDIEHATRRTAPDSTYKIYDALFGLEEGVIAPENSFIPWDQENYPFEAWNADQTLESAMQSSVNWYFQALDERLGASLVRKYIRKIGYGNEDMSGDFSAYYLESSLKISPIEQVELLTKLYDNRFGFAPENIQAVKNSLLLFSSEDMTCYGKTGTGRVDGLDVNGWFVGYIETANNIYFFATNISANEDASGRNAAEITLSILSDMNIWDK